MKLKVLLLDNNENYIGNFISSFGMKYSENIEIYFFNEQEKAIGFLKEKKTDIFLASENYEIDLRQVPKNCAFAYFVESSDIDSVNEQPTICKFQKAENIYKQMLSMYAEKASKVIGVNSDGRASFFLFSSPCGGTGTSSVSAAFALYCANRGYNVLYLDMEKYSSVDTFFSDDGNFNFSDVIFALKNKKNNMNIKLESCVKHDKSGVYFYSAPNLALDIMELNGEDYIRLVNTLNLSDTYNVIIVDKDFDIGKDGLQLMQMSDGIFMVSDGTEIANRKMSEALKCLSILEKDVDVNLLNHTTLIYNKFDSANASILEQNEINYIGDVIQKYPFRSAGELIGNMSKCGVFENILNRSDFA